MNTKKNGCGQTAGGCLMLLVLGFAFFVYVGSRYKSNTPRIDLSGPPSQPAPKPLPPADAIPGLQPVDVYLNLNDEFERTGPEKLGDRYYWKCTRQTAGSDLSVQIASSTISTVSSIEVVALNQGSGSTGNVAGEFFGYVATLPYDNSSPQAAKAWVIANINRNATKTFGPVTFEIVANAERARIMRISLTPTQDAR